MGLIYHRCPFCGTRGNIFQAACTECGADSRNVPCKSCGAKNPLQNNFCRKCGEEVRVRGAGARRDIFWVRGPEEIAHRESLQGLTGALSGGVIVTEGTTALLHVDGRLIEQLQPGAYGLDTADLDSGGGKDAAMGHNLDILFTDLASHRLDFSFPQIRTADGVTASVKVGVTLKVTDPARFSIEVVKDQATCELGDVRSRYFQEIMNAVADAYGSYSLVDINSRAATKRDIEARMDAHLAPGFRRDGLELDQVHAMDIEHQYLEDRSQAAEQDLKADIFERRAELRKRLREAVLSERFSKAESDRQMHDIVLGEDREKLLGQQQLEELEAAITSAREDRELARQNLLQRIRAQHDAEMAELQALGEEGLQAELHRREIEHRRREDQYLAEQQAARREGLVEQARAQAEARRVTHEQELEEDAKDFELAERMRQSRLDDEWERAAMAARAEDERVARLIQLSKEGPDALLAYLGGSEGAQELAALRRNEQFRDMSPEQILAASSPEALARMMIEQAKAQAEVAARDRTEDLMREMADRQERAHRESLGAVKDVAASMAGAQAAGSAQTVEAYREGSQHMAHVAGRAAGATGQHLVCPTCKTQSAPGTPRCTNCGHRYE